MSALFDFIIVAVIAVCLISGWRNGLVKSVMHFASGILAFFAAVFFTPYLGPYISDHFVKGALASEVSETLNSLLAVKAEGVARTTAELFADMPSSLTNILERFGVNSADFVGKFTSDIPATEKLVSDMSYAIVSPIALMLSSAMAFIIIFVLLSVILRIVTAVIGVAFELPVLKQFNEVAGLAFGVVSALFYAAVLSSVFCDLAGHLAMFDTSMFPENMIEGTHLVKFFHDISAPLLNGVLSGALGGNS